MAGIVLAGYGPSFSDHHLEDQNSVTRSRYFNFTENFSTLPEM
jgi:hypothetical protein